MVDKEEIQRLLEKYFFISGNITIADDGRVSVAGYVVLKTPVETLPVKFGKVEKGFNCDSKGLESLEGCPKWVGSHFDCSNNDLTSLEGSPETVGSWFNCDYNRLGSLQGAPRIITGWFGCPDNPLKSLQGIPDRMDSDILLDYSPDLPLLRLLIAKKGVVFTNKDDYYYSDMIEDVLNQFAGQGKRGVPACMVALNNIQKERNIDIRLNIRW